MEDDIHSSQQFYFQGQDQRAPEDACCSFPDRHVSTHQTKFWHLHTVNLNLLDTNKNTFCQFLITKYFSAEDEKVKEAAKKVSGIRDARWQSLAMHDEQQYIRK